MQEEPVELHSRQLWHVPECTTTSMDMRFELHPGTASTAGAHLLRAISLDVTALCRAVSNDDLLPEV